VKMATRGLLVSLAILVALVPLSALGQWVGRMDETYGVRETSFTAPDTRVPIEPVPENAFLPPDAALAPAAPGAGPLPGFPAGAPENSPCTADGDGYCCPPNWSVDQGVRVLTRSRTRPTNLSYQVFLSTPSQTTPVTTKALGFDVAAGYYATVAHYLGRDTSNRDQFVEFNYWGMNSWDESKDLSGTFQSYSQGGRTYLAGNLYSYFNTGDHVPTAVEELLGLAFNEALEHQLYYSSEIDNFEVNLRLHPRGRPDRLVRYPNGRWRRERQPGCFMSYLGGFRYLSINEHFAFSSRGGREYTDGLQPFTTDTRGRYSIDTNNEMFGIQIGGELTFRDRLWEFGARYKLGPMLSYAEQDSQLAASQVTYSSGSSSEDYGSIHNWAHKVEVSGLAEIGVQGLYKLTPRLTFHAAYDWIFITNLAFAPEQVDYRIASQVSGYDSSRVNTNGHALYHGLTLGLEYIW